jgi:1-acyl-sn-glycerol-3-phosphate acyltransferase
LSRANQEPASRFYRFVAIAAHIIFTPVGRRLYEGSEKLPRSGGILVVSNHVSRFDPVPLAEFVIWSGRWPRFLAKESLFRRKLTGWVMRLTGSVPVDRDSPRAADVLIPAAAKLRDGQAVVMFPEGTESRDPEVWPMAARTGAARLALTTGVPVIPVAQWGVQKVVPPVPQVARDLRNRRFQFVCGDPIDLSEFAGLELTREVLDLATTRIMDVLTAMLAEIRQEAPPAGRYDRRAKERLPVVRELSGSAVPLSPVSEAAVSPSDHTEIVAPANPDEPGPDGSDPGEAAGARR